MAYSTGRKYKRKMRTMISGGKSIYSGAMTVYRGLQAKGFRKLLPKPRQTIEVKSNTYQQDSGYQLSTTGDLFLLNGIAQGTDFTQRIGSRFTMKSICLNYELKRVGEDTSIGLFLVYDKQASQASPAVCGGSANAVLDGTIASPTVVNTQCPLDLSNRDRFVILYHKVHHVTSNTPIINHKKFIKLNVGTTCEGASNAITAISTGSLHLMAISNIAFISANRPELRFMSRLRYIDA